MARYDYVKDPVRPDVLQQEAVAAAVPVDHVDVQPPNVQVYTTRDLTPAEKTTLDNVVAAHDGRPRQKRTLYKIFADIKALSTQQYNHLWADANSTLDGVSKYLTSKGVNAAAIFSMDWTAQLGSTAGGQQSNARTSILSMYVQDNPSYAVNPSFDTSINVPGDEPIP